MNAKQIISTYENDMIDLEAIRKEKIDAINKEFDKRADELKWLMKYELKELEDQK